MARLMIVEDDAITAMEMKQNLEDMGYDVVVTVDSGEDAIDQIAEARPDAVLMDIRLRGEMDGIEAAKIIRSQLRIPVIFLTAYIDEEKIKQAHLAHPFGFLLKPVQERDLKVAIETALYLSDFEAERQRFARELEEALKKTEERNRDIEQMLEASRAILHYSDFSESARLIFEAAKKITGAQSGYVALLSEDGSENEVLFLDSGGLPCTVDPELPMPIRGLREIAYRENRVTFDNDFANSKWVEFMPEGHVIMRNVLFSPLTLEGKVQGLLGLANKKEDFTEKDAEMAGAFGELAAIALLNSRLLYRLKTSEASLKEANAELESRIRDKNKDK